MKQILESLRLILREFSCNEYCDLIEYYQDAVEKEVTGTRNEEKYREYWHNEVVSYLETQGFFERKDVKYLEDQLKKNGWSLRSVIGQIVLENSS